jgi:hypothetical protein
MVAVVVGEPITTLRPKLLSFYTLIRQAGSGAYGNAIAPGNVVLAALRG